MKLIGITGKAGAGKTTLSEMIGKESNVGVIHVDELFEKVKKEKLSSMMEHDTKGKPVTIKKNIKKILYGNKYIFLIFSRIKGIVLTGKINKKIQEFENVGKDIVVIESVHLRYFPIFKKLDKKVLVKRPYAVRQESVLSRDKDKNMDKETFALWDIPFKRSYYKDDINSYEYKIDNNSIENLQQAAEEIYKEISQTNEYKRRKNNFEKYRCKVDDLEKRDKQIQISSVNVREREGKHIYEVR